MTTETAPVIEYTPDEAEALGTAEGPWTPKTLSDLDWCLERIGAYEAEAAEIQAQLHKAIETLTRRAETISAGALRGATWFRSLAEAYVRDHRDQVLTGKKKSRDLLHGKVAFRAKAEKLVVTDKAALQAWLEETSPTDGLYRVKLEPEMKALQERFQATGEIPPGMDFEAASESLSITAEAPPVLNAPPAAALKE